MRFIPALKKTEYSRLELIKSVIDGDTIEFDQKTKEKPVYFLNFGKTLKS